jgi:phosphoglycolate phosphatase
MCPDVLPGCRQLLDFLYERNIPMSILTGRSETTCNISVEVLHLEKYFIDFQYGSLYRNEKSDQLRSLMNKYALKPDEIVYIGDAVSDVEACRAAGVKCFSAAWAKSARLAELEQINPGLVFHSPDALIGYLQEHI